MLNLTTRAAEKVKEIRNQEDLAEQGVDDLLDIEEMTEERAGELIMTARAPWFAEAEAEAEAAAEVEQ